MKTNGSDAKEKQVAQQGKTLKDFVQRMAGQIKTALPANITPERMVRIAMTAIAKDPKLAVSTPESFMGSLLTSAQLGLECNTPLGQAYLIPYHNSKAGTIETQFQLGYQGLLDLCYRTGHYKTIQARVVYKGDDFAYEYGLNETLTHKPQNISKEPIYVYAYYQLNNGAKAFEVMSWNDVLDHAKKFSQSSNSSFSPWKTDPESMAKKTVLKKVLKYAPKTVEVAESLASDTSVINTRIINDGTDVSFVNEYKKEDPVIVDFSKNEESFIDAEFEKQEALQNGSFAQ